MEGIFEKESLVPRRMKRLVEKGEAKFVGWVMIAGVMVKLWFWRELIHIQHEAEISHISAGWKVGDVLRFSRIPPDWRKKYRIDGVIHTNGKYFFYEHDKDTEKEAQIVEKMRNLADSPFDVLWTCPSRERLTELVRLAPNDRHWFTTYEQAIADPHGEIWINQNDEVENLEHDDQPVNPSAVQCDVQSE